MRRRFEETLSEGRGKQLVWLLAIIVFVILVFKAIGSFGWQELIAIFLDPGGFAGAKTNVMLSFLATILGVLLFSACLISVFSNIFENMAYSFRNGLSRYKHKGHILILGGGHHLTSMLFSLLDDNSNHKDEDIVVLTSQPVEELRSKVFSLPVLDETKEQTLKRRVTFYYGERDNESNLTKKDLALNAKVIYIIGEDNEVDHDSMSIRCCKVLQKIFTDPSAKEVRCYMVFKDSSSIDVFKYIKDSETFSGTKLRVDVVDANEYLAEQVLVEEHDSQYEINYPRVDYRDIINNGEKFQLVEGIRENDDNFVHIAIAGTTNMARAMALTSAHICHFPNYKKGKRRTIISLIDTDMKAKMDKIVSSMEGLFKLSWYRFISFRPDGAQETIVHQPDEAYGDFLDIEWEFIDGNLSSPGVRSLIEDWTKDSNRSLSFVICQDDQEDSTHTALHLPRCVYEKGYPILVQQEFGEVIERAATTHQYGNIHAFGMVTNIQDDPLFERRSSKGQKVNFIYNQAYGNPKYSDEVTAWYTLSEAHKFSSIYSANAMYIRERSFELSAMKDVSTLDEGQQTSIYEVEHRRWMMSELILGYTPYEKEKISEWKTRRMSEDTTVMEAAIKEYKDSKGKRFVHYDITPYDNLIPEEKHKDKIIIDKMGLILRG